MASYKPLEIILAKKTNELVLIFHKNITKLLFLWSNMGQKNFKVLTIPRCLQIVGSAVFAVGLYVNFDKAMNDYVEGADLQYYQYATGCLMAASCMVMITSFIACCGAYMRSRRAMIAVSLLALK